MGSTKTSGSTQATQQQSTQYTPTAEETELNKLQLEQARASQQGQIDVQKSGLYLANALLKGQALPGYLSGLPGGLDEQAISGISDRAIKDIQPYMQSAGLLDSGVNAAISARTSADIRNQAAQFNINNLMQLLNLGVGGQAQVQAPITTGANALGSRLSALAGSTTTGTTSGTQVGRTRYDFFTSPFTLGAQQAAGQAAAGACWVASELFGGWDMPKTVAARFYVNFIAPKWFKKLYIKFGKQFASWIKNKPMIKAMIKPIFEVFAKIGGYNG